MVFRTPIRRKTRQKSGFNVSGNTPGSECRVRKSGRLEINDHNFEVNFQKENIVASPLFKAEKGIILFGAYVKPKTDLEVRLILTYELGSEPKTSEILLPIYGGKWNKIGIFTEFNIKKQTKIGTVKCNFKLNATGKNIGIVDFFGINLGALDYDYFKNTGVENIFYEKISIYIPEISYQDYDGIQLVSSDIDLNFIEGEPIITKSCNRCSRFLPIDVQNERNTLSFSNHCVKKAPCSHTAFFTYSINASDYTQIPNSIATLMKDGKIKLYHGYQLECKSCKKFFVNAPLNPLRNSTQHREDSLRRRAIEVLVDTLLKREWIYHKFRLNKQNEQKEFDKHIWEKFGKRCFKCNKQLKTERLMDLDHTMPLASFWPLDETATCLCKRCNSLKSDKFPIEFYSESELLRLSKLTGLDMALLKQKIANKIVIEKLIENVEWFFDNFLNASDYQKVRSGKRTSDLIYKAILKTIRTFYNQNIDLIELYEEKTGRIPKTITN